MAEATLTIGDWHATCEACGRGADPDEPTHVRVLGPERDEPDRPGCGVRWTHVRPAADSMVGAEGRIRAMRPDLVLIPAAVESDEYDPADDERPVETVEIPGVSR